MGVMNELNRAVDEAEWDQINRAMARPIQRAHFEERKKMAFVAVATGGTDFAPPPTGMITGRCYRIIDLGTQPDMYQGQTKGEARKILLTWELLCDERMEDGRPFSVSKALKLSLHEKSALRKLLQSWRGKQFTPEEEAGFDVSKVLGAYCMLNMTEYTDKQTGKPRVGLDTVNQMPKGMPRPDAVNDQVLFDVDNPDMALFETFSEKIKEQINGCREWRMKASGHRPGTTATGNVPREPGSDDSLGDDDIPF